ncbi:MAG: hypothetical protein CL568_09055 [Alphaproteobacteria bacterium]|nr:hypothetical protein [Alphaproteobacteria bacterium]PPR13852.1 MAG: hypothetical protein CFH42_00715 [Alphaproteobacteria bacterium MarineAlpha12_Bin1]
MIRLIAVFVSVVIVLEVSLPSFAWGFAQKPISKNVYIECTKHEPLSKAAQLTGVRNIDSVKPALLIIIEEALKSPLSEPKIDMRTKLLLSNLAYYD